MIKPYISHDEATILSFKRDPKFAAEYLNSVLEDGDQNELIIALLRLSKAFGMNQNTEISQLNPQTIYHTLSLKANPELKRFQDILSAMGMRFAVLPI
ncbi:MAG: addiction module antidote protein [Desulfamplus sp.]|nr:addiction module antidote protein [Desulfamplus sp.]